MRVTKRDGTTEPVNLNKITERLRKLITQSPKLEIDPIVIAQKVVSGLYDGVSTKQLDILAYETSAMMSSQHPDWDTLAARLVVSNLHKETTGRFSEVTEQLFKIGILNKQYYEFTIQHRDTLDALIDYDRDYLFDYFGVQTLKRSYLLKSKEGFLIERPQDMWLRVATFLHMPRGRDTSSLYLQEIKETYDLLSNKYFTHATPTLFNAGCIKPQLSSCFLLDMDADSITGIYKTLGDCAKISQSAGGIGLAIHKIRSKGSYIHGTNGTSNGIVPMLRVFDATARYVDQGGGRRKGSIAVYLEPWHADIFDFLELKKNTGKEELRARDLFYALWVPDLFMERCKADETWTLFDPAKAYIFTSEGDRKYLYETYGSDFESIYKLLEATGEGERTIKARELWDAILESQIETGTPYILYKDAANRKSNQNNLGTIKSSNLCAEIIEYSSPDEVAVCNLASLSLPSFIKYDDANNPFFDFDTMASVVRVAVKNLNKVIDITYYPIDEARRSNLKHRPIGIGVQGLADTFARLKYAYDEEQAAILNRQIFEVIYKAAIDASIDCARTDGTYESYAGSEASKGRLQFHLWGLNENDLWLDWGSTLDNLRTYGLRNSLLVAPMPTASTAQILGNNETFEPFASNIFTRRTLAGEFIVVNKHLIRELIDLNLWDEKTRQNLIKSNGSVQGILQIPQEIRDRYKTVWEISPRVTINMAADRGPFVCQSQSMNLYARDISQGKLTSMHFYGWEKGLKTGMYYLRTEPAVDAIKFTITNGNTKENLLHNSTNQLQQSSTQEEENIGKTCDLSDPTCESCSG